MSFSYNFALLYKKITTISILMATQVPQELLQLTKYLSLELTIPFPEFSHQKNGPNEQKNFVSQLLHFGYHCLNALMSTIAEGWQPLEVLSAHHPNSNEIIDQQLWAQFIGIVEQCFLEEGDTLNCEIGQINIDHLTEIFGILCHGCQSVRKNVENLMENKRIHQQLKQQTNKVQKRTKKSKEFKQQVAPIDITQKSKKKHKKKAQPTKNIKKEAPIGSLEKEIIQTISKTMKQTKKSVPDPKFTAKIRDKEANSEVQKAKRRFDFAIQNTQKENKSRANNKQKNKLNQGNNMDTAYLKYIQNKHKNLNEKLESQQLKYYLELRDKKVAYIRNIHKLIEKLERQRQIQLRKQQQEQHEQSKKQMRMKLDQVDSVFNQNIEQLTENYKNKRKIQCMENVQEIKICRELQKNVKQKKQKQLQDMRNLWDAECKKLQSITGDEQKLKNKLIQIYRKHRV